MDGPRGVIYISSSLYTGICYIICSLFASVVVCGLHRPDEDQAYSNNFCEPHNASGSYCFLVLAIEIYRQYLHGNAEGENHPSCCGDDILFLVLVCVKK
jgi:hypothetical protein